MAQRQALAGESVVQSVNHYRKIHANVDIPLNFVVPNDSTWPADLHGFRLGNVLRRVKYKGALPEYHQELENIGFIMSASDHKFDLFLRSLKRYKELNDGCTKVPAAFVVPENVLWPEEMWGLKLGKKVITTRARKSYQSAECTEKLNELGFTWEPVSQAVTLFLGTLKNFKEVHGHLNVPKNYVVPHKSIIYPPEAWGMKIGFKVSNFIYRDNFHSYKEEFEKIGLLSGKVGTDTRHWEFIYMSMKTYRSIYGHLRVRYILIVQYTYLIFYLPPMLLIFQ